MSSRTKQEEVFRFDSLKDQFLFFDELGLINYLDEHWGWEGKVDHDGSIVSFKENRYAAGRLIASLIQFEKNSTAIAYLRDLGTDKFQPGDKREQVRKKYLSQFGLKKISKTEK